MENVKGSMETFQNHNIFFFLVSSSKEGIYLQCIRPLLGQSFLALALLIFGAG